MIEHTPETSMTYDAKVIKAAAREYVRYIEGYGEYSALYLLCLTYEWQRGRASWVVTLFNETQNRAVLFETGRTRYVADTLEEANRRYVWCLNATEPAEADRQGHA